MKAICKHTQDYTKRGYHHYGGVVAVMIECDCCKKIFSNPLEPTEQGAVKAMKASPTVIDITGFTIENEI